MTPVTQLNFGAVFDSLPSPFLLMDTDFNIVALNRAYLDATLHSRESLIGVNIFTAFPAEGKSRRILQESFERVRRKGVVDFIPMVSYSLPVDDHFEERLWSCTHAPIRNKNGEIAFLLKNTQDISELRESKVLADEFLGAQDSLEGPCRESVRVLTPTLFATVSHLRHSIMHAPNFICALRKPDLVFEFINHAFLKLAGGRDLVGRTLRETLPEIAVPEFLRGLENVLQTGEVFMERRMRFMLRNTRDGVAREHFLDFAAQPLVGANGEVLGVSVQGNDVTGEVRAEKGQVVLIRELHHRVTHMLATAQRIGTSTAKSSATIEEFQKAYASRLASLAEVMTREFDQSVSFRHLASQELSPHSDDQGLRVRHSGPCVGLPSHHRDRHGGS